MWLLLLMLRTELSLLGATCHLHFTLSRKGFLHFLLVIKPNWKTLNLLYLSWYLLYVLVFFLHVSKTSILSNQMVNEIKMPTWKFEANFWCFDWILPCVYYTRMLLRHKRQRNIRIYYLYVFLVRELRKHSSLSYSYINLIKL